MGKPIECTDAVSREDAIKALQKVACYSAAIRARMVGAIEDLPSVNPQPCTDAVSRQAVLDEIDDTNRRGGFGCKLSYTRCRGHIEQLPSVNPQPCDDAISRQAVCDALLDYWHDIQFVDVSGYDVYEDCEAVIDELPSVTQKSETVTEFADRCRECGARYGKLLEQKSGKWIPVSERLPEDEQEILFSTKTGRVHIGKYHDDNSANQWYSHRDKCRAWNNVVNAWMPLPEPYEPQESEE